MRGARAPVRPVTLDSELISFLGVYFYKSLKGFHIKIRLNLKAKFDLAARNSFTSWHKIIPGTKDNFIAGQRFDKKKLSGRCNSSFQNILAVIDPKVSIDNLNCRIEVISIILGISKERLKSYILPGTIYFNLFACIYDLLFVYGRLRNTKEEILHSLSGYSNKFPSLTFKETVKKLNILDTSLYDSKNTFKRTIMDLISLFGMLKPYLNYDLHFGLTEDYVIISPDLCLSVKTHKSEKHITPWFNTFILSKIYNYDILPINSPGFDTFYLSKSGLVDIKLLTPFLKLIEKMLGSPDNNTSSINLLRILEFILRTKLVIPAPARRRGKDGIF